MPQLIKFTTSTGCQPDGGFIQTETLTGIPADSEITWQVVGQAAGVDYGGAVLSGTLPRVHELPNDIYNVSFAATGPSGEYTSGVKQVAVSCSAQPGALQLDALAHTDETAAGDDGTATIQASGGKSPLTARVVELSLSQPATAGQSVTFPNLPPTTYTVQVVDSSSPAQVVGDTVTIAAYVPAKTGCTDEYADTYDPEATDSDPAACAYSVRWRSVWGPAGMSVQVPALPGQTEAFTVAELRIGFRAGHPLAEARPLDEAITLRATVGPDGYATFRLAPYLWPALGAADGRGGYRLDLNSLSAFEEDVYVGYELRRTTGELLEHGYALNAAVPDAALADVYALSPFGNRALLWTGFEGLRLPFLTQGGAFGIMKSLSLAELADASGESYRFPCPVNPLPVAWLAPGGGYGYWVFSGRPQLGDEVGEGQAFTEPASGQRRYSQRGESRGTTAASTGVFNGPLFAEGLRTLWSSPQVWLWRGEQWVPVTLGGGSFPVRRVGLPRTEITLTFTEATPHYAQGQ